MLRRLNPLKTSAGLSARRLLASSAFPSASSASTPPTPPLPRSPASLELPQAQISVLENGLTVATETCPGIQTATVGMWIDAGSRAESEANNGTAHFLEHLAFKGTKTRSQYSLELEIENLGAHLNAYTSRESTVFYAKAFREDVEKSVEILADILQNSRLDKRAIERERDVIIRESDEVDKLYDEVVFDHLHAVCFPGQPLGRTILGPKKNILAIQQEDLRSYISTNYKADRMVLVGTGAVDHTAFLSMAQHYFGRLQSSGENLPLGSRYINSKPAFQGSETRISDESIPVVHVAMAVEGVSWKCKDYFTSLVAHALIGNYDRATGNISKSNSPLLNSIHNYQLANSFMSFSTSYSDTGLWGVYFVSENQQGLEKLMEGILAQWGSLAGGMEAEDVEMAKSQLKSSLLMSLDGTTAVAEDIGRQLITTGCRMTPGEVFAAVDGISASDVAQWAEKYVVGRPVALVALGTLAGLPSYERIMEMRG